MTLHDLIQLSARHPAETLVYFLGLPLCAWLVGRLRPGFERLAYCLVLYAVGIPGIVAAVLLVYSLGVRRVDLLQLNLLIYVLPLVSTGITVNLIRSRMPLALVPGADRLSGLVLLLATVFALALVLLKTRIWIFLGGGLTAFVLLIAGMFLLLRLAFRMLGGRG